jgi:hypothetical protein
MELGSFLVLNKTLMAGREVWPRGPDLAVPRSSAFGVDARVGYQKAGKPTAQTPASSRKNKPGASCAGSDQDLLRFYLCGFDVPDCGCLAMGVS